MYTLENSKAQALDVAMASADISKHVAAEIQKMVKSRKSPLIMCREGISRLAKAEAITAADQKKLLEIVTIVFKFVDKKINAAQAQLQKQKLYEGMLFVKAYSSTALCIVNAVNFDQDGNDAADQKNGAKAQLSQRQNAALGAMAGGLAGGLIGFQISGGNPFGAGLGAAVGAIAGAIYGACTAD